MVMMVAMSMVTMPMMAMAVSMVIVITFICWRMPVRSAHSLHP